MKLSLIAVVCLVTLTACGGGGSGGSSDTNTSQPSAPEPSNEKVSGIWFGTSTGQQSGFTNDVSCLITQAEDLACFLFDPSTGQLSGAVHATANVTNGDDVSGSGSFYAAPGYVLFDGSTFSDFTVNSGTVDEGNSLVLTVNGGGESSDVSLTYDALYDRDSSLSAIAGVYRNFTVDGVPTSLSIDENGELFAQSQTGCVGNGEVAIEDPMFNEYSMTITISNCPGLDGTYNGLAVSDDFAATDDALLFGVFSGQIAILGAAIE